MDAATKAMVPPCTVEEQIEHALRFAALTHGPDDWREVRLLPSGESLWFRSGDDAQAREVARLAIERNSREHDPQNVYVGANPRAAKGKRTKADIAVAYVLFADFDNGTTVEESLQRIREAGLPAPSIVIVSGNGVHVYWLLAEPITDMAAWTATMKGIIAAVGSDGTIHNPDRIMRWPGTRNVKPERPGRPMCHIVSMNDTRHPITAFPVKAARPKATEPAKRPRKPRHPAAVGELCDEGYVFMHTGQVEGERRPAVFRIACDMKARGWSLDDATQAIVSRAPSILPPLTDEQIGTLHTHVENAFKEEREPGYVSDDTTREAKVAAAAAKGDGTHDGAADLARPQTLDDTGAARRLAKMIRGELLYVRERKTWGHWDGRRWCDNAEHIAVERAKQMHDDLWRELAASLGERSKKAVRFVRNSGTHARLTAAVTLARSEPGINVSQAEFDTHPWLLNVRNGVLDLQSGELRPHNPALRMTQLADVTYDPDARSELWESFIREVTSGDDEKARFLQQSFGLALTADVSDEVLVCHNGGGCNGKSTALEAVGKMLGDYAAVAPPGMFAVRKFDAHPTEIAGLRGKRFVTAVEQEGNRALRESLIKQLTGGDTIRTRGMREDFWEMPPTWHIHMAYNVAPRLTGTDDGIRRRLIVVPWNASFKGSPDPTIKERLTGEAERSGILNWCLDGLRMRLAAGRLVVPEACQIKTDEYIDDEDVIGRFIIERTEPDDHGMIELREMLRVFRVWMEADGVPRYVIDQFTANALGRELARRGYRKMRPDSGIHRKQTVIAGLRLVESADDYHSYHDEQWQNFAT